MCREFESEVQDRAKAALSKSTHSSTTQQKQLPQNATLPRTTTNAPIGAVPRTTTGASIGPVARSSSSQSSSASQQLLQVSDSATYLRAALCMPTCLHANWMFCYSCCISNSHPSLWQSQCLISAMSAPRALLHITVYGDTSSQAGAAAGQMSAAAAIMVSSVCRKQLMMFGQMWPQHGLCCSNTRSVSGKTHYDVLLSKQAAVQPQLSPTCL